MLEGYVGEDAWREGVRSYMKTHAYANTASDDLWHAVETAAKQPIIAIARDFTLQPGVPMIRVGSATCREGKTSLQLTQGEFTRDRPDKKPLHVARAGDRQVAGCVCYEPARRDRRQGDDATWWACPRPRWRRCWASRPTPSRRTCRAPWRPSGTAWAPAGRRRPLPTDDDLLARVQIRATVIRRRQRLLVAGATAAIVVALAGGVVVAGAMGDGRDPVDVAADPTDPSEPVGSTRPEAPGDDAACAGLTTDGDLGPATTGPGGSPTVPTDGSGSETSSTASTTSESVAGAGGPGGGAAGGVVTRRPAGGHRVRGGGVLDVVPPPRQRGRRLPLGLHRRGPHRHRHRRGLLRRPRLRGVGPGGPRAGGPRRHRAQPRLVRRLWPAPTPRWSRCEASSRSRTSTRAPGPRRSP